MVGIRLFPFGMVYFQGRAVSFREGMPHIVSWRIPSNHQPAKHWLISLKRYVTVPFVPRGSTHRFRSTPEAATMQRTHGPLKLFDWWSLTLPKTNIALENRPSQKENSSSNHPFMLVSGRVDTCPSRYVLPGRLDWFCLGWLGQLHRLTTSCRSCRLLQGQDEILKVHGIYFCMCQHQKSHLILSQ